MDLGPDTVTVRLDTPVGEVTLMNTAERLDAMVPAED